MTTAGFECGNRCEPAEQVIGGRGQPVLVGAAVEIFTSQLLGSGIRHRAHREPGGRE